MNKISQSCERSIPVIDISPYIAGNSKDKHHVVENVDSACRDTGAFVLTGHGISGGLIQHVFRMIKNFFQLEQHNKQALSMHAYKGIHGYFSIFEENLDQFGLMKNNAKFEGDYKEGFDIGNEKSIEKGDHKILHSPNLWPNDALCPGFQNAINQYFADMLKLSRVLLDIFANALKISETKFKDLFKVPMATLRLLHYPSKLMNQDDLVGCGAHTDYGCFTILSQDQVGGLQIKDKTMNWVKADPIPDSFVINLGDMMEHWTNQQYTSTVHRVVSHTKCERYSIPFFFNPSIDTNINGISCEKWLLERYQPTFTHIE